MHSCCKQTSCERQTKHESQIPKVHDMRQRESELVKSGLENSYEYSSGAASRAGVNAETDVTRPDI